MSSLKNLTSHCFSLVLATTFMASQSATAQTTSTAAAPSKPNILMIFVDDMGYGDISSFSDVLPVKTPNIDRLAKEGMKFTEFYVAMPICSPSRAAVLSGMFSPETQLTSYLQEREGNKKSDQNDFMDPALSFLPKAFHSAGYATGHVGKWHLGGGRDVDNAPSILKYGYDEAYSTWESPNRDPKLGTNHAPWDKTRMDPGQVQRYERTEYMVDKTLDFMKRHQDKPTFVTLWPDDLHLPFRPSPEMMKKYGGKPGKDNSIENFYGVLEEYDIQMGRLLDGLKAQGMEENTIIFFTGDHGPAPHYDHKRNNGMRGMKLSLYEGGIRQPFLIRWPGHIPAGTENNETILSSLDLLPTLTKLAGIELSPEAADKADGQDLSQAVLGKPVKRTKPLMWEYGRTPKVPRAKGNDRSPELAIREGDFKLLVNRDNTGVELYNLRTDRNETTNVADKHTTMVQDMSKRIIDWSKTLPHRTHPYPAQ